MSLLKVISTYCTKNRGFCYDDVKRCIPWVDEVRRGSGKDECVGQDADTAAIGAQAGQEAIIVTTAIAEPPSVTGQQKSRNDNGIKDGWVGFRDLYGVRFADTKGAGT